MGIWNDDQARALARIADFLKANGAAAGIQLAHAGRKASTFRPWSGSGAVAEADGGWQTVAPSALAFADSYPMPRALTVD
jgi:2,4-dienoyl-CoA reductase-like NADH-dependent reductase (Old Yellow Enzyme family)